MISGTRHCALGPLSVSVVLLISGCSGHSVTAGVVPGHGRTLSGTELKNAGLTASELPEGFTFVPQPDATWSVAKPSTSTPIAKPGCQPLVDLLFGTGKASAEVAIAYQGSDPVDVGSVRIATYSLEGAQAFFASVKDSLRACPGIDYPNQYVGEVDTTLKQLPSPGIGDDSLSFGLVTPGQDGLGPHMQRFDYVRTGAGTTLVSLNGTPKPPIPPLSRDLLTAQAAKLQSAQS